MKKFIILIVALVGMMSATAQKNVPTQSADGVLTAGSYVYLWGTSADTLTNADTLSYTYRVKGEEAFNINCQLYNDRVSGTASGSLVSYTSIDGINFVASDTITVSSISADALDSEVISYAGVMHPYIKFVYIQSGTAVCVPKLYFITRKN
jgi:opacity protein-like surface antigen